MLEPRTVPELVSRWKNGDANALDQLFGLCGAKLRTIAGRLMNKEPDGHTLQATALVHEMYLRLNRGALHVTSEGHFLHIAGRVMRRLLIDHARGQQGERQAGVCGLIDQFPDAVSRDSHSESGLAIQLAYGRLRDVDAEAARIVWLRAVEGYTIAETAEMTGRPPAKVREDFDFAIQWMANQLTN